jgi:hypothetical protein
LDSEQREHDLRAVFNALCWLVRTDASWREQANQKLSNTKTMHLFGHCTRRSRVPSSADSAAGSAADLLTRNDGRKEKLPSANKEYYAGKACHQRSCAAEGLEEHGVNGAARKMPHSYGPRATHGS